MRHISLLHIVSAFSGLSLMAGSSLLSGCGVGSTLNALAEGDLYDVRDGRVIWVDWKSMGGPPTRTERVIDADAVTFSVINEVIYHTEAYGRDADHVYCYLGHIHHRDAKEIGGMTIEHFGVLPPRDSWHNASGYGAERTMTCIVLHKEYGEEARLKVNAERLR